MRRLGAQLGALFVGAVVVALASAPPSPRQRSASGVPLLPRPELLRVVGAGHQTLFADLFWIQTIQQTGAAATAEEYRDIYYYADLVTDLDPQFRPVYSFAALAIPFNRGRETWVNVDESSRLLRKGLAVFPNDYQLKFLLGYNLLFLKRSYTEALEVMKEVAQHPRAPAFLQPLVSRIAAQAGDFETSRTVTRQLRDAAEDPAEREFFERRLQQIDLEELLQRVDAAAARYRADRGQAPATVLELVQAGYLSTLPLDPLGGTIAFDRLGRAQSTSFDQRLQVIEEFKKKELWDAEHSDN